jgi:glucose-6-phosphate 1-dehydrogenase
LFGASGDLAARKLVPALFALFCQGSLPKQFVVVGASRTKMTDDEFRTALGRAFEGGEPQRFERWTEFARAIFYVPVDYDSEASFLKLSNALTTIEKSFPTAGNRIFYLATPPAMYAPIGKHLGQVGLAAAQNRSGGWARLVVEKPFGRDLQSAVALDAVLHESFAESQIFRIDHYLAKETVQNILMLRFANSIFEPIWNRNHINYVGIMATEELGVEHRAGYYDQAGVLRDMFQNHMMQLLALTSMEPPALLSADRVLSEKSKVFRALKAFDVQNMAESVVLGQYGPGRIRGLSVPGYLQEPGVAPGSSTPTFAMTRLFVDNWRWRGVPFYLASGKRLQEKRTKIVIQFKEVPHSMFSDALAENITANRLDIGIYPQEKIALRFEAKGQGARLCLSSVNMEYCYPVDSQGAVDSYGKVLLDCILGDHMLFWDQSGIELSWAFLDPVSARADLAEDGHLLQTYEAGSWGPERARPWMKLLLD